MDKIVSYKLFYNGNQNFQLELQSARIVFEVVKIVGYPCELVYVCLTVIWLMVLANGSLSSQSGGEGEIRKNIINADLVECIVAMPTQLFYTTQIPVSLWFLNKQKKQSGKTLFIDARKMGTMVSRKLRELTDEDIQKIADAYTAFVDGTLEDVKGFCAVADIAEIEKQDFILTPGRYVGIEEQEDDGEPFEEKMTRLTSELSELFDKSHELEDEIRRKLKVN